MTSRVNEAGCRRVKHRLWLAVLAFSGSAFGQEQSLPRPKDLPSSVPDHAVIKRWSNQGEGGLLQITWDHSSMLWAPPCRSAAQAAEFALGDKRALGCPAEIDMQVRPLYMGTFSLPLTARERQAGSKTACCYTFERLGNR